jgi:murein DD-endopeptidase MepM/ murein hydrolase activator NlpD
MTMWWALPLWWALSASVETHDVDVQRLDVTWLEASAATGRMLVVDVGVAAALEPIVSLELTLGDERGVWMPASADRRRVRALVPIPVDAPAGPRLLHVDATLLDGRAARFFKPVAVKAGAYDQRHIKVSRQFTSPSQAQQRRAEAEAEALAEALRMTSSERLWRGSFLLPTAGAVTSPFGTLRTYNKKKKSRHLGLDLDGDVGAPIVAPNHGRVLLASERYYSGGTVVLDHGQGFLTMYFHMSRIDVVDGQVVAPGERLGAVGASGQVTGPHLHWTVKLDGHAVDPSQLLELDLSMDQEQAR